MAGDNKRVCVERTGGLEIYSVKGWPGFKDILNTCAGYLIVMFVFAVVLLISHSLINITKDLTPYGYFNRGVAFVIGCVGNMSMMLGLGVAAIIIPVMLVYQLSPKKFWIEDRCLCYSVKLLGVIRRDWKIPFDRILEIKITGSGSEGNYIYHLSVLYERKLPKLLFIILVHWNERFTQWFLLLANGLDHAEAEDIQMKLLAPMTCKEQPLNSGDCGPNSKH